MEPGGGAAVRLQRGGDDRAIDHQDHSQANALDEETEVLARIRAGLSVEHFETVRQAKDGRLVDISLTVSPIRDATGRIIGASKIARDIREHKRLLDERRIAAANEEAARREVLEVQNRRIQEAAAPEERVRRQHVARAPHAAQLDRRVRRADGRRPLRPAADQVSGIRAESCTPARSTCCS